jgi:hypothetical protein
MKLTSKDKDFLERLKKLLDEKELAIDLKEDSYKRFVLRQNYGDKVERIFGMSRQGVRWRFYRLINYPAASSGVLKQRQLMVFMELMIIISLLFHIIRDRVLIAMFPYGTCKIPIRPEFSSPKLFPYLRTPLEHFPCRNAFDRRYDFCHTIRRDRLHEEMYMILIYPYLQKLHLIALLNFHTHAFQCFIHTSVEYRTSVFRRKYQMVYQHRNIMTFVDIFAHKDILRRKRRGIQPEEI